MFTLGKLEHPDPLRTGQLVETLTQINSPLSLKLHQNLITCFGRTDPTIYSGGVTYYLCINQDEPVSQADIYSTDKYTFLYNVCTIPQYRRRGLGRTLLQFLLKDLKKDTWITLQVSPQNEAAVKLYSDLGFSWLCYGFMYSSIL